MPSHELSHFENYAIGSIIGLSEVLVTNPLFVIKTKNQQKKPIPWSLKGLYKGAMANALGFMPITAVQVGSAQWIERRFYSNKPTSKEKIYAAFCAGALSSFISCPTEMIMTLQNDNPELTARKIAKTQMQQYGISGLFRGQFATALREGSFSIFFLAIPPLIKNKIKPYCANDTTASLLAGAASGIAVTVVSQPVDTIKTTQQSNSALNMGFFQSAKKVGPSNLFKGILSRSSSVIISVTLMSWMKEQLEHQYLKQKESLSYANSFEKK